MSAQRWHRDLWAEAVWCSSLPPMQRIIALVYADHARDSDVAWVSYDRLSERSGMSRASIARHLPLLVEDGWLVLVSAAAQHRSARYRLVIPAAQQSTPETAEHVQQSRPETTGVVQQSQRAAQQSQPAEPAVSERDPTSVPTSVPTSSVSRDDGEEEDHQETRIAQTAEALRASVPPAAVLTRQARASLAACLLRGWTQEALVRAVSTPSWDGSTYPPGLLAKRLADCAEQSPPRPAPTRPRWCGKCHEASRMTDDDCPARCRTCHPLLVGAA